MARVRNILVLCQGNSARSIMAEAIINRACAGRFCAYSAGSAPKARPHPMALAVLLAHGHDARGLRSKSWDEFTRPGAPAIDIVITVCDEAAGEACPYFPGGPVKVHWGMPDPDTKEAQQDGGAAAFERTYDALTRRVGRLAALPAEAFDSPSIGERLTAIADMEPQDQGRS
ncbi:MAG: arsenate reductase ArsC [Hyphomicrobiaceae bacterium]|nr:arsenate reductase ArsC [Hyphomicrobiaceae bacterium]